MPTAPALPKVRTSLARINRVAALMLASRATMERLANGVPVYMGAGPRDREACLHFFPEGEGLLVYAWLDGAAWGVPAVQYHILGEVITGPFSLLPTSKA